MRYGIENSVWSEIVDVFQRYPEIDRVVLFGSRAMGNFKFNSDIDLALFSKDKSFRRFLDLNTDLEDLGLLYRIDLIDFNRITNEELKSHIERVGQIIFNSSVPGNKKGLQNFI
ncbi:nucleotidyltransferase domain-containing protein [Algoriphagus boritolerans]|uniref:Predicted nucleotidyltransferase n=1 Tax=Algoriphagus boritolerans DSM 17298 = JCM 18970 TaxID=1120964 RepID=A0A1H5TPP7_9BACT|nr:nucleotidyltransferase domain-containing protein [Algoriphagus boritolerans]SEF64763.1 Predicted nucleotidyltransferase [Algoriphagus boritolerans DSM 17298 = JCM 18970]